MTDTVFKKVKNGPSSIYMVSNRPVGKEGAVGDYLRCAHQLQARAIIIIIIKAFSKRLV
jgi:hypothetical protein